MEDPWANAWGESSTKSVLPEPSASSAWTAPSVSVIHGDHEDDLSTPSWPTEPAHHWGDSDVPQTSMWGSDISGKWQLEPSTFDRISLDKDPDSDIQPDFPESGSEDAVDTSSLHSSSNERDESPPTSPPHTEPIFLASPSRALPIVAVPPPLEDDGFGTFETAEDMDEERWSPSKPSFPSLPSADAAAWGAEWDPEEPVSAATAVTDLDDAWESAREQKEKQDRHVPPEFLASILRQLEALSDDLWPSSEQPQTEVDGVRSMTFESLGLDSITQRLVPEDLVLPANMAFTKTFTIKQMSEALKFTRHSPLTRLSPMAMYMSSKGVTSWEASVKSRPTVVQEDVTPVGWKIVETVKDDSSTADDGRKKSGGLFSFFGRRATNSSVDSISKRPASPVASAIPSNKSGSSPRASVDSSRSSIAQSQVAERATPSSPIVPPAGSILPNQQNDFKSVPATSVMSETVTDGITREPTPPPSAVSRFLGRFSGRPTRLSSSDSIALSTDDLEFLSDVPTALDSTEKGPDLDALSLMIRSPPLSTATPPRLPPPPKNVPQLSRLPSQAAPSNVRQISNDDFMSIFDAPNPTPSPSGSFPPAVQPTPVNVLAVNSFPPTFAPLPLPPPPRRPTPSTSHSTQPSQSSVTEDNSWASFDYPSVQKMKATPPPSQTRRPVIAIMSSSRTSSNSSPSTSKPPTPFSLPPPPSQNRGNVTSIVATSDIIPPLLPPPMTNSLSQRPSLFQESTPSQPLTLTPTSVLNNADDDDDFSDFLSSPPPTSHSKPLSFDDFMPTSIKPPVQNNTMSSSDFDAFGDFLNTGPPQPPSKLPLPSNSSLPQRNLPTSMRTSNPPVSLTRKVSKKEHSRTISLLETAAARGRWLAPPSPLPEALPGPPGSSNVDLFDGHSAMQAQQAQAVASLGTSFSSPAITSTASSEKPVPSSSWNLSPPPAMNATVLNPATLVTRTLSPPKQAPTQPFLSPTSTVNGNSPATSVKSGGLSAQDLSFFEGL